MSRTRKIVIISLTALGLAAGGAAPIVATAAPAVVAAGPATHLWGLSRVVDPMRPGVHAGELAVQLAYPVRKGGRREADQAMCDLQRPWHCPGRRPVPG
jgi:hypothetical protein